MSYLAFLVIFLLPPLVLLVAALRGRITAASGRVLALTALAAFLYTAPWDNAIILNGVWSFSPAHVLNIVIGVVPLEEYMFYVAQVLVTGLFALWLLARTRRADR